MDAGQPERCHHRQQQGRRKAALDGNGKQPLVKLADAFAERLESRLRNCFILSPFGCRLILVRIVSIEENGSRH